MRREKLSELLDISIGRTPSRNEPEYWGKGHRWVSIRDLSSKTVTETKEQITDRAVTEARCKIVRKGTLLFSFKLTIGKMAFAGCDLFTNEAIAAFSIKDETKLNSEFLYFALQSATYGGSNQAVMGKTLNSKSLAEIEIPFPPIDDQIRIAHLLGKVEGLIAQRKQHLKQLDDLLKSVFLEMFGDPVLNEKGWDKPHFESITSGMRNGLSPSKAGTEKGRVYTLSAVTGENFQEIYKEDTFSQIHEKYFPTANDFLVCRGNGNVGLVGKGYFYPDKSDGVIFPDTIIAVSIQPNSVNKHFFEALWKTRFIRQQIESNARTTNGAHKINQGVLEKLQIILPPVDIQNKFATVVEKIKKLESRYQQSLGDLEALYGALSQKTFKGELDLSRVPLPADQAPQINPAPPLKGLVRPTAVLNRLVQNAPPESRSELLARWFNRYLANTSPDVSLGSREFLEAGWQTLQETRLESEGESPALTLADYDALKDLIFAALEGGTLVQTFAEESNRVSLHRRSAEWGSF